MSKASEWVDQARHNRRPPALSVGSSMDPVARVTDTGAMTIMATTFSAAQALKLARWILDTFDDPKETP